MRAAKQVNDGQIAQLKDNLGRTEEELAAGNSIIGLDLAFHTLVAEIAANKALLLAREPISQLFYPALAKLFAHPANCVTGPRRLTAAHRHIMAAFKARNSEQAGFWMRRHIADFRRGYELYGFDLCDAIAFEASVARSKEKT